MTFFSDRNDAPRRNWKHCGKCARPLLLDAYAKDRAQPDGRQSWCRACKWEWERSPEKAWRRLVAELQVKEPSSFGPPNGWTRELYLARWAEVGGRCEYCSAGLREWQYRGHCLDRVDNDHPHVPGNCRFSCWPCNLFKGARDPVYFLRDLGHLIAQHRRGGIPWARELQGKVKRQTRPDIECFRVTDVGGGEQLELIPTGRGSK